MTAESQMNLQNAWVIANWKMNPSSLAAVDQLLADLAKQPTATGVKVVLAPSFIHLGHVKQQVEQHQLPMSLAAQNLCAQHGEQGAFTGEISAAQLADLGIHSVILGHSERRQYFAEANTVLAQKVQHAVSKQLTVIFCVGETAAQYDARQTQAVIAEQLSALQGLDLAANRLIVAYEPVWAIGTGKVPTVAEVDSVHGFIKTTLATYADGLAATPVLYGGSVKADNASAFAESPNVAGVLVGGASLNAQSFYQIIHAFEQK